MRKNVILIIFTILHISSCTYHLRYTISSEGRQTSDKSLIEKTYAVEKNRDSVTEYKLLKTLSQSLEFNGWSRVPKEKAQYIFEVLFETEKREEVDEFWYMKMMRILGGSSRFFHGKTASRRRIYSFHYLEINAYSDNSSYTWSSKISTGPVLQEIETLARHIIPKAISLFPEEGYWEIVDEVYLHATE